MVRVIPPPLMEMVAVRSDVEVLTGVVYETVPSFDPESDETVSHVASLLTVQFVLELMVNEYVLPEA